MTVCPHELENKSHGSRTLILSKVKGINKYEMLRSIKEKAV